MENIAEALKMAFAIIMFVLALGLSISSFSQARETIDSIITLRDRETSYTYVEASSAENRIVSAETIVPTLYKAYKENFEIRFYSQDGSALELYESKDPNGVTSSIHIIDLEKEQHANLESAIAQLDELLAGDDYSDNTGKSARSKLGSLYEYFRKNTFIETIGEYYQEDLKPRIRRTF